MTHAALSKKNSHCHDMTVHILSSFTEDSLAALLDDRTVALLGKGEHIVGLCVLMGFF